VSEQSAFFAHVFRGVVAEGDPTMKKVVSQVTRSMLRSFVADLDWY